MRRTIPMILIAAALAGCGSNASESVTATAPQAPAAATAAPESAAATPVVGENLSGTVQEQLDASPYLYLRIQTAQGDIWAAVPEGSVENGAQVTLYSPMLMHKFESKTLKRTFDEVYFGTLTPAVAATGDNANPHTGMLKPATIDVGKVDKASGADARSIEEAWADGAGLAGKSISVRGKVVKYNPGIMGKNWLHLQDGSGDASKGTNDLTVTTLDEVNLGDTVTITGTVSTEKDFGAGYSYALIVEDAKVIK